MIKYALVLDLWCLMTGVHFFTPPYSMCILCEVGLHNLDQECHIDEYFVLFT